MRPRGRAGAALLAVALLAMPSVAAEFRIGVPVAGGEIRGPAEGPATPCDDERATATIGGVVFTGPALGSTDPYRRSIAGPTRRGLAAGETGVVGARVFARRIDGPPGMARARTGRGGAFALALVPGRWDVVVRKTGFLARHAEVEARPAERRFDLRIGLAPAPARIVARVLDESGRPVAGARVAAVPSTEGEEGEGALGLRGAFDRADEISAEGFGVSDRRGLARLGVQGGRGARFRVFAFADGFTGAEAEPPAVMVADGRTARVSVRLERRTAVLEGTIVGATYDPVPGAWVRAVPRDRLPDAGDRVRTGTDGRFRLRLAGGRYRLDVEAQGFQPADPRALDVVLDTRETRRDHVVPLRTTDLRLIGTPSDRAALAETPPAAVPCARAWGPFGVTLRWRLDVPRGLDPLVAPETYEVLRAEGEAPPPKRFRRIRLAVAATAPGTAAATDRTARPGRTYAYALRPPGGAPSRPVTVAVGRALAAGIPFLEPLGW